MRKQKIMFIGSYSQDIFYLLEIAGELRSLGHECYFLVTNPIVAARNKALEEVREKGYEAEEMLESKFTERGMLSQMFSVNKARVEFSKALFKRLKPDLIITTKIVFYGKFFEVANSMNIPSVYYQWTFIHSRENVNRIKNKEYSYSVAKNGLFTMYKAKLRRKFKDFFTGAPEHWPFDAPYSYIIVISDVFKDFALQGGIDGKRLKVLGNLQCDEMFDNREMSNEEIASFKESIGLSGDDKYIIHTREDYSRLRRLSDDERIMAQETILRAMKIAAPEYKRVIKVHPKEGANQIQLVREMDPDAILLDANVSTPKSIRASSLMISSMSTTLAMSVGLDIPVISSFLWKTVPEYKNSRFYVGVDYADDEKLLIESIKNNLYNSEYKTKMDIIRKDGCEKMLRADGKSMERIIDFVTTLFKN